MMFDGFSVTNRVFGNILVTPKSLQRQAFQPLYTICYRDTKKNTLPIGKHKHKHECKKSFFPRGKNMRNVGNNGNIAAAVGFWAVTDLVTLPENGN